MKHLLATGRAVCHCFKEARFAEAVGGSRMPLLLRSSGTPVSCRPLSRRASRRGAVLIAALVCVAVAAVVFMSAPKMASAQRHPMGNGLWQLQAAWLAESGLERAAERLAAKPDFTGETWNVAPEQLGGSYAAVVRIRVEPVRDQSKSRLVRVEADYPDHPHDRARESRETILRVP